jgi:hypothetical protein
MGFKYPIEKHVRKGMMVRTFLDGSWSWTICYPMNYSNGRRHAQVWGSKRSHVTLRCCWKKKMLLLIHTKASRRKGCWSTINLTTMTKVTKAQLSK